jgi:hypothetical protein
MVDDVWLAGIDADPGMPATRFKLSGVHADRDVWGVDTRWRTVMREAARCVRRPRGMTATWSGPSCGPGRTCHPRQELASNGAITLSHVAQGFSQSREARFIFFVIDAEKRVESGP